MCGQLRQWRKEKYEDLILWLVVWGACSVVACFGTLAYFAVVKTIEWSGL